MMQRVSDQQQVGEGLAQALRTYGDRFLAIVDALDVARQTEMLPTRDNETRDGIRALASADPPVAHRLAHALRDGDPDVAPDALAAASPQDARRLVWRMRCGMAIQTLHRTRWRRRRRRTRTASRDSCRKISSSPCPATVMRSSTMRSSTTSPCQAVWMCWLRYCEDGMRTTCGRSWRCACSSMTMRNGGRGAQRRSHSIPIWRRR